MPLIHCVLDWHEAWKTSEGSIPSIGLGRVRTPYDTFFISRYRPVPIAGQL
uniref:Uncharacterized protein n=1 Tax=Siphoviridae sp. ctM4S20 TaxID=2825458 RepID=A0A8S5P7J6_9CAUD|nr:MAG TPA: hypothetical protein [Siphoviridae sp. ctM4S20]